MSVIVEDHLARLDLYSSKKLHFRLTLETPKITVVIKPIAMATESVTIAIY